MSRYIDADKFAKRVLEVAYPIVHDINSHEKGLTIFGIAQVLDEQTPADVVEVVRCKNCKFYPGGYFSDDRIMIETYMHCPNFKDDGFCSYGRRTEA